MSDYTEKDLKPAKDKLYVCLEENNKLSIHSREEVDAVIKDVEEDYEGELPYTVVGSIITPIEEIPFLFTCTVGTVTFYEVVIADSEEKAKEKLLLKKRIKKTKVEIKNIKNLSLLIAEYYS
jgi:hypothetical protein